jgi:hypothetical protein
MMKEYDFEESCQSMLNHKSIHFAGVIDNMGNLVSGGFKRNVPSLIPDKDSRIMYTNHALDYAMKKDFDNTLGNIEYTSSKRKNALMINIPFGNHLILISAEPNSSAEQIVSLTLREFHVM